MFSGLRTISRTARLVIIISMLTGVSVGAILGYVTGFFTSMADIFTGAYTSVLAWLSSPMTLEHLMSGLGFILIPLGILVVMFVITDH